MHGRKYADGRNRKTPAGHTNLRLTRGKTTLPIAASARARAYTGECQVVEFGFQKKRVGVVNCWAAG